MVLLAELIKAGKQGFPSDVSKYDDEWHALGVKKLKRKLLGFCGTHAFKSSDEIIIALYEIKAVDSLERGKEVIPLLLSNFGEGVGAQYTHNSYLSFHNNSFGDKSSENKITVERLIDDHLGP